MASTGSTSRQSPFCSSFSIQRKMTASLLVSRFEAYKGSTRNFSTKKTGW